MGGFRTGGGSQWIMSRLSKSRVPLRANTSEQRMPSGTMEYSTRVLKTLFT